jgi:hypothetical protein
MVTRLMYGRVQSEVADQLLGTGEPTDVADGGQDTGGDDGVDTADGHQALDVGVRKRMLRQVAVDDGQFSCQAADFIVMAERHPHLVGRKRQCFQTRPTARAEDVPGLLGDQVRMKDGLDAVLEPRYLADQLRPLGDDPPLQLDILGRHPNFREELRCVETSKGRSVDLVRLDLGPSDCAYLERVGNDHATYKRPQQPDDDGRIAGRLQHDVVFLG